MELITDNFNYSSIAKNFSGVNEWNNLTYISMPKNDNVTNAYLNVTGLNDTGEYPSKPALDVGND